MSKLKFLWKKFRSTDTRKIKQAAQRISKKTGRNPGLIYLDILKCIVKYGTGFVDYEGFEMYDMSEQERRDFLTIGKNNQLIIELNDPKYRDYFEDKIKFNEKFDAFVKREWMVLDGSNKPEFGEFLKRNKTLIVKPVDESCGKGIEKVSYEEGMDTDALYDSLYSRQCILAEEVVVQSEEMDLLCTSSVNTVRLVTIYNSDDDVSVVAGAIRMGREGNYVDNFNHGGLAVIIDVADGVSVTDGYDKDRNTYKTVPEIGTVLKGFQCPMWDECTALVKEASKVVPQIRYVAWDVAVSKDHGPLLIEGNSYPGQDVTQYPKLGLGTYKVIRDAIV